MLVYVTVVLVVMARQFRFLNNIDQVNIIQTLEILNKSNPGPGQDGRGGQPGRHGHGDRQDHPQRAQHSGLGHGWYFVNMLLFCTKLDTRNEM